MGCALSAEEKEEFAVNDGIEKQIKEDGKKLRDEVKMLLLGTLKLSFINLNIKFGIKSLLLYILLVTC